MSYYCTLFKTLATSRIRESKNVHCVVNSSNIGDLGHIQTNVVLLELRDKGPNNNKYL